MRRTLLRLANLFRNRGAERELNRELDAHLALMREDLEARGFTPEQAKRLALRSCGGVEQTRELHSEAR